MGLFKKKPDPISERAKLLNNQIAALEEEIKKLADQKEESPATPAPAAATSRSPFAKPTPSPAPAQSPAPARAQTSSQSQPRLRSTAMPHGPTIPASSATQHEPIFEEVGQSRIQSASEPARPAHFNELGVRKYDLASAWQRLKNHFRGPVASNPKLVHYLSAGSIQGLRPLRYEKRVARNRFIAFAVVLVLALLGLISLIMSQR